MCKLYHKGSNPVGPDRMSRALRAHSSLRCSAKQASFLLRCAPRSPNRRSPPCSYWRIGLFVLRALVAVSLQPSLGKTSYRYFCRDAAYANYSSQNLKQSTSLTGLRLCNWLHLIGDTELTGVILASYGEKSNYFGSFTCMNCFTGVLFSSGCM